MPRFEYTISVNVKRQGKIQIDGKTEGEAYEKLIHNINSGVYDEDMEYFPREDTLIEIEDYDIIEEE